MLLSACSSLTVEDEIVAPRRRDCTGTAFFMESLCEDEIALLGEAAKDRLAAGDIPVNQEAFQRLTKARGVEYATAVIFQRINGTAQTQNYLKKLNDAAARIRPGTFPRTANKKLMLAMVPGMYYNSNASIGGDGAEIRASARDLGFTDVLVNVNPDGSVEENGRFLCDWLSNYKEYTIVLASISKGASDIKRGLQLCGEKGNFDSVRGWLNIGGINRGSYLINEMDNYWWYRWRAKYFFRREGYSYDSFLSVRVDKTSLLYEDVNIPKKITVVNIIATPTWRHVTRRAEEAYTILSDYGPNDGLTLLADSFIPDAVNVAMWGTDHYFSVPERRRLMLYAVLLDFMERLR